MGGVLYLVGIVTVALFVFVLITWSILDGASMQACFSRFPSVASILGAVFCIMLLLKMFGEINGVIPVMFICLPIIMVVVLLLAVIFKRDKSTFNLKTVKIASWTALLVSGSMYWAATEGVISNFNRTDTIALHIACLICISYARLP